MGQCPEGKTCIYLPGINNAYEKSQDKNLVGYNIETKTGIKTTRKGFLEMLTSDIVSVEVMSIELALPKLIKV